MSYSEEDIERFWRQVSRGPGCWIYGGGDSKFRRLTTIDGKRIQSYVFSFILHTGGIPEGMHVLHTCDNGRCVRPDHLYLGGPLENSQDAYHRSRARPRGKVPLSYLEVLEVLRLKARGNSNAYIGRCFGTTKECIWRMVRGLGLRRFKRIGMEYEPRHVGVI